MTAEIVSHLDDDVHAAHVERVVFAEAQFDVAGLKVAVVERAPRRTRPRAARHPAKQKGASQVGTRPSAEL
ncbi:hypothetical protein [Lentzea sp. HUAS12]|uniref:hypothetical protein n=1 Tax=Lentzea sp. HUAS12 TaxID=2951806 RepID=UPI0020A0D748|nr:hypothetical protein [Lentzea sp. HUAS12]USX50757.1 hypothetical protein ND450_36140 [Lentzea sp. HUAS12]